MSLRNRRAHGAKRCAWILALFIVSHCGWAQTPQASGAGTEKLEFEVASVKLNKSGTKDFYANFPLGPGDVYFPNGGSFVATNFPLIVYINFAYRITSNQAPALRKHLPDWVLTEHYDITAKTEKHDATKNDMRAMMRSLLAERFHLQIHSEDEEQAVYGLTLVKPQTPGPRLQPHPHGEPCAHAPEEVDHSKPRPALYVGQSVYPELCGGVLGDDGKTPGTLALAARDVSMSLIASTIVGPGGIDRAVVDRTGLPGTWDFLLEFAPERRPEPGDSASQPLDSAGPGIEQALKEQLGLKLVPEKAPVQVWVVDHIEHASEN